jgi:hypothetical protein
MRRKVPFTGGCPIIDAVQAEIREKLGLEAKKEPKKEASMVLAR